MVVRGDDLMGRKPIGISVVEIENIIKGGDKLSAARMPWPAIFIPRVYKLLYIMIRPQGRA